jgi:RNA polymerase sigma factor (sigma-70 family)
MDDLIEENMGLVVDIVKKFKPKNHTERQDLVDAGRIGLWKALQKYDLKSGNAISTYAWRPIRWSIIREIKNQNNHKTLSLIENTCFDAQHKERLWELFTADMTEEEKSIIKLRQAGYKFREICNILEQSPSSVKNKFYNLLVRLREANKDE